MPTLPVVGQWVGLIAVLAGLFLLLPVGAALCASGALVLVASVLLEAVQARSTAPASPRTRDRAPERPVRAA